MIGDRLPIGAIWTNLEDVQRIEIKGGAFDGMPGYALKFEHAQDWIAIDEDSMQRLLLAVNEAEQ